MKFNRDLILKAIIDEKSHFLRFIDYINEHHSGGEFPKTLYIDFFERHIRAQAKLDLSKANLIQLLSLESLIDNHIFADFPSTGQLVINKTVLDILSFLDTKRTRQLVNAQFEDMRKRTVDFANAIQHAEVGSQQYQEIVLGFKLLLNEIHSNVQENCMVLHSRLEGFAEEYRRFEIGESQLTIQDLYTQVNHLFLRNVKPFLDFTSTDQILSVQSFHEAVSSIIDFFEGQCDIELSYQLSYRLTAITSYYKDIQDISERISRYLHQIGQDRSSYLAIENAFADLMQALEPLRHGGFKNIKLKPDAAFFDHLTVLDGLADHKKKYQAKLNLAPENNRFSFEYYLERLYSKPYRETKILERVALPKTIRLEETRKKAIMNFVAELALPEYMEDIYLFIHNELKQHFPDYSLKDILFGLEMLLPLLRSHFKGENLRGRVEDERYYLEYSVLSWQKNEVKYG
ncbi:hypothetical protein G9F32_13485 [Acinetobacter sp. 194]|uniref:hypothetical protein n=1 Tax=Acinetobacter shaoyimingii TaxID=2715164 RepID=UPI00140A250F|nr:hypothetical protein [Acinetobacter shaoyimingii]NHB59023.1 hypothetical protein [Acinetobacter shaoyimingii]